MRKWPTKTARHFKPRRCILGGAEGHSVTTIGKGESDLKRQNPCDCKGFGVDRRQLSLTDKEPAAGVEPAGNLDVTGVATCSFVNCDECRAALALHSECAARHCLASLDTELQWLITVWDGLSEAIRSAIVVLIASQGNVG
jgi:hypothetical protein